MRRLTFLCLAGVVLAGGADRSDEARSLLQSGHTDEAIQLMRAEIATDPDALAAGVLLTETLLKQERFDEADDAIAAALARHPSDAKLNRVLGDLRYREGLIFDADKAYKIAVKADKNYARAYYGISRVFETSCLRKHAAAVLQLAHAMDPQDSVIAAAFYSTRYRLPKVIATMEEQLAEFKSAPNPDAAAIRSLETLIAEGKALGGNPECAVASAAPQYRIRLGGLHNGKSITGGGLPVQINGQKTEIRFDTGAHGFLLSSHFAQRAGVQRLGDTEISGIGNGPAVKGWVGYAPDIYVGDLELKNCIVEVPDKGSVDDSGGLIGSDVFKQFLVKIAFRNIELELDPLPGPAWDGHTPVDRYEGPELAGYSQILIVRHHLLIPSLVSESKKKEQTRGLFLFDTGAGMNMISTNLAPEITKVHNSSDVVRGVSGKVKTVYEANQIVLQFDSFRQSMLDLISFDLSNISRSAGTEVSGIMGLPLIGLFQSVTLDYRDGRIKFEYKP
ncbi:MAG TPA: aspartyl protease family protein [Bryobacteraceae bacterium]|nr:aspartyl protease family protein [Bryobacteraceae bacterium]